MAETRLDFRRFLSEFTIQDGLDFQDACGLTIEEGFGLLEANQNPLGWDRKQLEMWRALVWVVRRLDDPDFSFEDAKKVRVMESMGVSQEQLAEASENPTTPGEGNPT